MQITAIHNLAELRALISWAHPNPSDRPNIAQVIWGAEAVYATNGHRLLRIGLRPQPERRFAISVDHLVRWVDGMARIEMDGHRRPERGTLPVELVAVDGTVHLRALPRTRREAVLSLPASMEPWPSFDEVLPAAVRSWVKAGRVPPDEERKIVGHAIAARYLDGIAGVYKAFHGSDDQRRGADLISAPGALDPIVYAFEVPHTDDRESLDRGVAWSAQGLATMLIMPMRRSF